MNVHTIPAFPSIITAVECDLYHYIRKDLIDWIYKYQSTTETVSHSNRGGWQSPDNFHLQESFSEFKSYILNNAFQALTHYNRVFELNNMWININKKNNYNLLHSHANAVISGVFWVKAPKNCGELVFTSPNEFVEHNLLVNANPEFKKQFNFLHTLNFTANEGWMVLFPSQLLHLVEPNESDEDRISIAFNLV